MNNDALRAAFLASSYGTDTERVRLAGWPEPATGPVAPGQVWAILTAYNPDGVRQAEPLNACGQRELTRELTGWALRAGVNGDGVWAEPSLIVSGLPLRRAIALGRKYGQAAVLWGTGRRAALVWCGPDDPVPRIERHWLAAEVHGSPSAAGTP